MSDIKIQPSATGSGTVTITAPTTNTARVITLPDSAGTLVGVDQNGNLGIAITPETDWTVYNSIQIGGTAAFAGNDGTAVMGENWKFAGGNKYIKASEASRYYTNNGNHVFQTAPLGSADADITWTTALEALNTGRVRATNGIMFGTDTAASNALDDYEEGDWTPTWSPTGGSWSGTGVGKYTKIGRQVTASFNWLASGQATGTKFNSVSGLPFTSLNETTRYPAIVTMNGAGASGHTLNATVSVNSTSIDLQMQPQSTGAHGEFTPAQTASGAEISATVTYFVA